MRVFYMDRRPRPLPPPLSFPFLSFPFPSPFRPKACFSSRPPAVRALAWPALSSPPLPRSVSPLTAAVSAQVPCRCLPACLPAVAELGRVAFLRGAHLTPLARAHAPNQLGQAAILGRRDPLLYLSTDFTSQPGPPWPSAFTKLLESLKARRPALPSNRPPGCARVPSFLLPTPERAHASPAKHSLGPEHGVNVERRGRERGDWFHGIEQGEASRSLEERPPSYGPSQLHPPPF